MVTVFDHSIRNQIRKIVKDKPKNNNRIWVAVTIHNLRATSDNFENST